MPETYQKLSDLEHVLARPDVFVGSMEHCQKECCVWQGQLATRVNQVECPALGSIIDEILTNAQDRQYREDLRSIDITCNEEEITVRNDGAGIPIQQILIESENLKIWIPELVFSHFRAGSNFNDEEVKFTGGRFGLGSTLCNAYSDWFQVEVGDCVNGKSYVQTWKNNMSEMSAPKIGTYKNKRGYTMVRFKPDYKRFGFDGFPPFLLNFCKQRAYDVAACTNDKVNVSFNGERVPIKSFKQYSTALINSVTKDEAQVAFQSVETLQVRRLEVAVAYSSSFQAYGFVNGLRCNRGKHIDAIVKMISKSLREHSKVPLKSAQIKSHLLLVCRVIVDNPSFDSQTKECLSTAPSKFGFDLTQLMTPGFCKRLSELPILEAAQNLASLHQIKTLKTTSRVGRVIHVDKLEDALDAKNLNNDCRLILTEGDSAKELAVASLAKIGRDKFGVYPLIGKILNPRNVSKQEILDSPVSMALMKIIGLEYGKVYDLASIKRLRYPLGVVVFSDQDLDGDHIYFLIYNWFVTLFPSVLEHNKFFIDRMCSPVITAKFKNKLLDFFSEPEFEHWYNGLRPAEQKQWTWLYLKGTASSSNAAGQRYFSNLDRYLMRFKHDSFTDAALVMAFDKNWAGARKEWLAGYDSKSYVDYSRKDWTLSTYMDIALRAFSFEDCKRNLPQIDGFKPSQRKILYVMMGVKDLVRCADLQGDISRQTAYHHGSDSLFHALVSMSQVHWCTNNINLFHGEGQFGSRNSDKYGSSRYLAAKLEPFTRILFPAEDDSILERNREDNKWIEPKFYHCILPFLLVNGAAGIGTGYSTKIPPHNPLQLVAYLEDKLSGKTPTTELRPWFELFRGPIVEVAKGWDARGVWKIQENQVLISEIPPGFTKERYLAHLTSCLLSEKSDAPEGKRRKTIQFLTDIQDHSTHTDLLFVVTFDGTALSQLDKTLPDLLWLQNCKQSFISNNNYVVISNGWPRKFASAAEIIEEYFPHRLEAYNQRLTFQKKQIQQEISQLEQKMRFIKLVCSRELELSVPKQDLYDAMVKHGFPKDSIKSLLQTSCSSFCDEKIAKLQKQIDAQLQLNDQLQKMTAEKLWQLDLDKFKAEYPIFLKRKQAALAPCAAKRK